MTIALTDDLTGLPNRRCFQSLFADKIRAGAETGEPFALGLIDLDGFKPINDTHGHPVGDANSQAGGRSSRQGDGRTRFGRQDRRRRVRRPLRRYRRRREDVIALEEEIQSIFRTPFAIQSLSIPLSAACGFALFPSSAADPSELVRLADAALYRAKAVGPANVTVLDRGSRAALHAGLPDGALRRRAAPKGGSSRPLVGFTAGRIRGSEASALLHAPSLMPISAPAFIPVPEQIRVLG